MLSQLRREISVLRHGQSLLENRVHAGEVESPQRLQVEPQTGETLRPENTIRVRLDRLETLRRPREAGELFDPRRHDQVLTNSHPLVQALLSPEVARVAGHCYLDDQFGRAGVILPGNSGLTAVLGK